MGSDYEPSLHGHTLAFLLWVFYNSKYVELLDTAFIIATKQFRVYVDMEYLIVINVFFYCSAD